jgi:hypothetical protein
MHIADCSRKIFSCCALRIGPLRARRLAPYSFWVPHSQWADVISDQARANCPGYPTLFRPSGPRRVRLRSRTPAGSREDASWNDEAGERAQQREYRVHSTVTIRKDTSDAGPNRHSGERAIVGRSPSSALACAGRRLSGSLIKRLIAPMSKPRPPAKSKIE